MSDIHPDRPRVSRAMRGLRKLVGRGVIVLAVAGCLVGYARYGRDHGDGTPKYKTVHVERGKISAKVTATGTLSARVTVQVGSQVSGRISELFVDYNSRVKKGDVLAKIDPRLFQAEVQKARADAAQAAATVAKAKTKYDQSVKVFERAQNLKADGLIAQADYDAAESAVAANKADLSVARAQSAGAAAAANEAEVNLSFTTISSPIDGIVLSRSSDVGQTVAASLQAPTLFTIAEDLQSIQVDTFVAEADVGKMANGTRATFTVDAYPGTKFKGLVRDVRSAPLTVQNVVTYDAVLDVKNEELKLKPGMTANVTFIWAEKDDVIRVPNAALRFRPPGAAPPAASATSTKERCVWVLRDGKPVAIEVKVGLTDGTHTEVTSGKLGMNDDIIIDYVAGLEATPTSTATHSSPLGGSPAAGGGRKRNL